MTKGKQGLTKASALLPGFESLTPVLQERPCPPSITPKTLTA